MVKVLFTLEAVIDMKETGRTTIRMVKVLITKKTVIDMKETGRTA